jgi:hypothetical protein
MLQDYSDRRKKAVPLSPLELVNVHGASPHRTLVWIAAALVLLPAWAQGQAPAPDTPPVAPEKAVVLENLGKPMVLPFRCTGDDIEWAGLTCSNDEPCPVYLEIAAAESAGNRIVAAGNLHTSSVTLYSVLLGSADAGRTWREMHPRMRGTGLDHIQFFDPATGWASGQSLFPLAQDPFLLLTSDGGETWQKQVVSQEIRYGAIQQFHFTGRAEGSLIVDRGPGAEGGRYALYESTDGGRTWDVRETTAKPMRLKGADSTPPDWRVRADAESFRVEERRDGRWAEAAAFAVKVGACKGQ